MFKLMHGTILLYKFDMVTSQKSSPPPMNGRMNQMVASQWLNFLPHIHVWHLELEARSRLLALQAGTRQVTFTPNFPQHEKH